MSTSVESLFVPIRYYTAQDIYYYQVDNRPLQDIVTNLTTLAETSDTLSQTVTGVVDVTALSGNVVDLTATDGLNAIIVLTGTLTSPCTSVFPSGGAQSWVVSNQTNEVVYVSYVGSANSTPLESGYVARFYTDGTNMVGNVPAGLDQANTFSQPQTFASTIEVEGGATLASTLDVSGGATLASTLDVSGGATFAGALTAEKNATFNESINVNLSASVGSMANYGADTVYTPVTSPSSTGDITITAAMLANGLVNRSGPTAAFTDTLDSGSNLNSYLASTAGNNQGFRFVYVNTTSYVATIAAGTGITIVGPNTVDGNSVREFVIVQTGGSTFSVYAMGQGSSGPAVTNGGAVQLGQVLNVVPDGGGTSAGSVSSITYTSPSIAAPSKGILAAIVTGETTSGDATSLSISSSVSGYAVYYATPLQYIYSGYAAVAMTAGQSASFTATAGAGASGSMMLNIGLFFYPTP